MSDEVIDMPIPGEHPSWAKVRLAVIRCRKTHTVIADPCDDCLRAEGIVLPTRHPTPQVLIPEIPTP